MKNILIKCFHDTNPVKKVFVFWQEVPDAVSYDLILYVKSRKKDNLFGTDTAKIARITKGKDTLYHTFDDITSFCNSKWISEFDGIVDYSRDYYFYLLVSAEDRDGKLLCQGSTVFNIPC